ncbi:HindVP family restriction endonuclease [Nostoc sp. TCL26-01]|uniref:HindVP family restriction endonuclease n=1 Tax=Nostoc sp. TCL26-01 TaxID=2576904 RepID=UPI0015B9AC4D|nr:HindVP family restriction endonuclease [Nostoc sp. TCL26-01]QLE54086.1 HindVP family restriction endonuclease [Nostoc sp. TCL26-01]
MFLENRLNQQPGLFGLKHSNRDFTQKEAWGKNCFNSSFPASLCSYLHSLNLDNIYIKLNSNLKVDHSSISTASFYGINPNSDNLFYAFETQFTPYQQYLIGNLPGVDLVTQARDLGSCLQPIEIKLTALPDNTTCDLAEDYYGCEIVVRPDTIVYLACSIVENFRLNPSIIGSVITEKFANITDWTEAISVIPYIPDMIDCIDAIALSILDVQKPFLMQPIWKTEGKSPNLSDNCLDVFVWSNLAFTRLFIDLAKIEISAYGRIRNISRHTRTIIWLFKMLSDFSINGSFNHRRIIDNLSYNTKNDKAFAVSGRVTHVYMKSAALKQPRIKKQEIKRIILGGGQNLLSPERRFDAIIVNSPDIFDIQVPSMPDY